MSQLNHHTISRDTALATALLRVSLGLMYIAHSLILKYFTFGLANTAAYFVSLGLPAWLAYVVFSIEFVGGILLVLGVGTRAIALSLSPILLGAVWVHAGNGWVFTSAQGGWEYPLYLLVLSIAQFLLGDGAYSLSRALWPETSVDFRQRQQA